ncbi:MAG: hypothetical protein V4692_04950 [Bdellovibrionota bacterium]
MTKRFSAIFLSLMLGLLVNVSFTSTVFASNASLSANSLTVTYDDYDRDLNVIRSVVIKSLPKAKFFMAGGTARSLAEHVLTGRPFAFRDFDLAVVAEQQITKPVADQIGRELEGAGLGKYSSENLRPRPRANPELPGEAGRTYNAGFGFFVKSKQNVEYDISIFHSKKDVTLNGLLDIDQIRVDLTQASVSKLAKDKAAFKEALVDPNNGVSRIVDRTSPSLVNWADAVRDPLQISIRVVRAVSKFGAGKLDEVTLHRLREANLTAVSIGKLQIARNLLKLLADDNWISELETLSSIAVFDKQFTSFKSAITKLKPVDGVDQRAAQLLNGASTLDALEFLKLLSSVETEFVTRALPRLTKDKNLRVGYFSGEFAPFHRGHYGVVETALTAGKLDLMFVIPTPHPANDPKTVRFSPLDWKERQGFVTAGLAANPRAWTYPSIIPAKITEATPKKLGPLIDSLDSWLGSGQKLTHVFGLDSFHRVIERNLPAKDPRPRIAVTRAGVPMPEVTGQENTQVLQNIYSPPVSATRILQELSFNDSSDNLSPEVQRLVKSSRRYQRIIVENRASGLDAQKTIKAVSSYANKIVVWDPRETHSGLWDDEVPNYSKKHRIIISKMMELGAQSFFVDIEDSSPALKSWKKASKDFPEATFTFGDYDKTKVPYQKRIRAWHSGSANEGLANGWFLDSVKYSVGIIFLETPDQPLSPLLMNTKAPIIKVSEAIRLETKSRPKVSCSAVIDAA